MAKDRGNFTGFGFILAAAGSAIGLGNIWKFPYITYANEGGSFVVVYLISIALIAAPIMMAEIIIGRRTQASPVTALLQLGQNVAGGKLWSIFGYFGVLAGFVILTYYAVVAGWTVYYLGKCLAWSIQGFDAETAANLGPSFGAFLANGPAQIGFQGFFLLATMSVVLLGVQSGIERINRILMPILIGILAIMCVASVFTEGFKEAFNFLFHVGPITRDALLEAVGHSFFTLSLGMGAMITYGSYMSKKASIRTSAMLVCLLDTVIGLMACIVMFSIIFSVPEIERGTTFSKSAAILFTTLPRMFYGLPGGAVIAPVFYTLISFAALTSTISMMEVIVSYFIDQLKWARKKAATAVTGILFLAGIPVALSLGANATLSSWAPVGQRNAGLFSILDYLASNWMLPIGGFFIALFVGWFLSDKLTRDEVEQGGKPWALHGVWKFLLRVVCPIAIGWIIVAVIGGKTFN